VTVLFVDDDASRLLRLARRRLPLERETGAERSESAGMPRIISSALGLVGSQPYQPRFESRSSQTISDSALDSSLLVPHGRERCDSLTQLIMAMRGGFLTPTVPTINWSQISPPPVSAFHQKRWLRRRNNHVGAATFVAEAGAFRRNRQNISAAAPRDLISCVNNVVSSGPNRFTLLASHKYTSMHTQKPSGR
jgi:hypothetical protein